MKMVVIIVALMALVFAAISANAQTRPSAGGGMSIAEFELRAKGDDKGADRIARARCFSGVGACSEKFAAQRARAIRRAHAQGN